MAIRQIADEADMLHRDGPILAFALDGFQDILDRVKGVLIAVIEDILCEHMQHNEDMVRVENLLYAVCIFLKKRAFQNI